MLDFRSEMVLKSGRELFKMPAVSSNIQSLLDQCDRVHDAFQEDRIPREHPNHKAAVYHQSYLLGRIKDLRAIIERLGMQNAELIDLAHRADALTPKYGQGGASQRGFRLYISVKAS